jgi:hypothetical protein
MSGNRKFWIAIITMLFVAGIVIVSLVKGIPFTGDNVVAIVWAYVLAGAAFTGGNAIEHLAKAKGGETK